MIVAVVPCADRWPAGHNDGAASDVKIDDGACRSAKRHLTADGETYGRSERDSLIAHGLLGRGSYPQERFLDVLFGVCV